MQKWSRHQKRDIDQCLIFVQRRAIVQMLYKCFVFTGMAKCHRPNHNSAEFFTVLILLYHQAGTLSVTLAPH